MLKDKSWANNNKIAIEITIIIKVVKKIIIVIK
jgi:hypothetical protein